MTKSQKSEIEKYTKEVLEGALFDFLKIFEEHEAFKIKFQNENTQVELVEISEMLKAEPIVENGWINRFSAFKFSDTK
ncbi:hypothetical protein [Maribacter dokdonensis]|uniref:hypothetical protein n=1 Tax=Maribacter dokdonensis TaxID=320912 RepID=UPI002AB0C8FD|nr:hypothetical protein [Maribacter dokdonensis]